MKGPSSSVTAVAAAAFAAFVNLYALQSLLPMLSDVFHATRQVTSLTVTASTLAMALASPFAGRIAARVERRKLVGTCVFALTLTTLLGAAAPGLGWLIVWRFFQGLFLPPIVSSIMSFIGEQWTGPALGRVMANYVAWTVIGGFSGRFVAGWGAAHLGWREALAMTGVLNALAGLLLMGNLPRRAPLNGDSQGSFSEIGAFLRHPEFQAAFASGFNTLFSLVAMFTYVTFYLAAPPFSLGPGPLGSMFCVYLVGVVITPLSGLWMGRLGFRLTLMLAALTAACGALLTMWPSLIMVLIGLALCCSGAFVSQAAASGYVSQLGGPHRTTALGLYLCFYYLGGSAGAAFPGYVWQLGGWPACVMLIAAVQCCTVFIVAARFRKDELDPRRDSGG